MINFIKLYILNLLYSDRYLNNYRYTQFRVFLLNKISPQKVSVFKIKNFLSLPRDKRILNGYCYTSKTQDSSDISIPDLNLYIFKKAIINSRSSAMVVNSTLYYESINDNERFNEGFVKTHTTKNAIVKIGNPEVISDGFFLAGNGSHNWYHWLLEILPKMLYYKRDYSRNILVSRSCKDIPSMAQTLQTLVQKYEVNIIYLDPLKTYHIKKLYFINEVNKLMYNELNRENSCLPLYYYRKESLEKLVEILKNRYLTDAVPNIPKIYLQRQNTHRIARNEAEIAELLGEYQFSFIDLGKCSIQQQVEIFSNAKHIVGTSGAAFTNILFCYPNTKIVIFMPDNYMTYQFYKEIGELLHLDVVYLYYENGNSSHEDSGFSVNQDNLHQLIKK